jgi:hypothetical protein
MEKATEIRVPRDVNVLSEKGGQEPRLTPDELARVDEVYKWARKHESCLTYAVLGLVPRLMEMVYALAGHVAVELRKELVKVPLNPSPLAKDKSKRVDKGKGILIEPEKPKKAVYPIRIGGDFKIQELRPLTPPVLPIASPAKKSPLVEKKNIEDHPKVVRVLKLVDEEESEVEKPNEATPKRTLTLRFLLWNWT